MAVLDHFTFNGVVGGGTLYITMTLGLTYQIPNNIYIVHLLPSTLIAAGTVVMPTTPNDGQIVKIVPHQTITLFTIQPSPGQAGVIGAPTLGTGNVGYSFQFRASDTNWYRLY